MVLMNGFSKTRLGLPLMTALAMGVLLSVGGAGAEAAAGCAAQAVPAGATAVGSWSDLTAAVGTGSGSTLVYLTASVTETGQSLSIPSGRSLTLDLCGFDLSISDPGTAAAAIDLPPSAGLTVEDTSTTVVADQGALTVTGGDGSNVPIGSVNSGGAAIGGAGGNTGSDGGSVRIDGGRVSAQGGAAVGSDGGGAGIGGGGGAAGAGTGAAVTISGGSVEAAGGNAVAGRGGAGIGAGGAASGSPESANGTLTVEAGASVPSLSGEVAAPISITSGATLSVPAGSTLAIDDSSGNSVNDGTILAAGRIIGTGKLANNGSITVSGSGWSVDGQGPGYAPSAATITGNAFHVVFTDASGTAPASEWVFAPTFATSGESLPAVPARAGYTAAWVAGTTTVSQTTALSGLASGGAVTVNAVYTPIPPTISYSISSRLPESSSGWWRTPVRVRFTCAAPAGAALTGACPAPRRLAHSGRNQTVRVSVSASNGASTTLAVTGINIDRDFPRVQILGVVNGAVYARAPRVRCHATEPLSGVRSCRLTTSRVRLSGGYRETVVAVATSNAGNSRTVSATFSVYVARVRHRTSVPIRVHARRRGARFQLVAIAGTRPVYEGAARGRHVRIRANIAFRRWGNVNGTPRWRLTIRLPRPHRGRYVWRVRVRGGGHSVILRVVVPAGRHRAHRSHRSHHSHRTHRSHGSHPRPRR